MFWYNAGRGLQPRSKRLDAPQWRYITQSRPIYFVIFQREWQYQTFETGVINPVSREAFNRLTKAAIRGVKNDELYRSYALRFMRGLVFVLKTSQYLVMPISCSIVS